MTRHQPVNAEHLRLHIAKLVVWGITRDQCEAQVIFLTQQCGESSQPWASDLWHRNLR